MELTLIRAYIVYKAFLSHNIRCHDHNETYNKGRVTTQEAEG